MLKNKEINKIFDDLDAYREFCVKFGRVYNEQALYNNRDNNWRDYLTFKQGKTIRNHWNTNFNRNRSNRNSSAN